MKAMLLRIGIDSTAGGALGPIFDDGSFEYIPIPEGWVSQERNTYKDIIGRRGRPLSEYIPEAIADFVVHYDPEFETCTYGDPTSPKRSRLLKLEKNDLLVFYAGLDPYNNIKYERGLYIIGYFLVDTVIDFNTLADIEIEDYYNIYKNSAHLKRNGSVNDLVMVVGEKNGSKLLDKAIKISQLRNNIKGSRYHAVSKEMERLLGISGSIQRSSTPRIIIEEIHLKNLRDLLGLD
ncbi:MAG: hypothetical protein WAW52_09515 [Methanothrix sp.]